MIRSLKNTNIKKKRVLVRVDLNVPLDEQGNIVSDFRIKATLPTIEHLLKRNAIIILMSHLGSPKGKVVESLRLTSIQDKLLEYLDISVTKASDWNFDALREWVEQMQPGEIFLLENLRFHPGEKANDPEFAKNLASLADIFVNDAFGTCHRPHASIVGVPEYLPSCAGLLLEKEVEVLSGIINNPARPLTAIMGGAKVSTKINLIKRFLEVADSVLLGGVLANTVLKAKGMAVGKSIVDEEMLEEADKFDLTNTKLHLPVDAIVSSNTKAEAPVRVCGVGSLKEDELILDIGPDTLELFSAVIRDSKTVFWNGPLGFFEKKAFAKGTEGVALEIARSGAYKVIGGGDVVSTLEKLGLMDKFDRVSTGGGSLLKFLAGEKLVGIEALR